MPTAATSTNHAAMPSLSAPIAQRGAGDLADAHGERLAQNLLAAVAVP